MSLNAGSASFVPGQGFVRGGQNPPPAKGDQNQQYTLKPRVTEAPAKGGDTQQYKLQPRVTEAPSKGGANEKETFTLKPRVTEAPQEPQYKIQPRVTEAPPAQNASAQVKASATKSEPAKPAADVKPEPKKEPAPPPEKKVEPKPEPKAEPKPEPKKEAPAAAVPDSEDWEQADPPKAQPKAEEKPQKAVDTKSDSKPEPPADESSEDEEQGPKETHREKKNRLEAEAQAELISNDDPREHLNIVFIGHVDSGKSTISGQVLFSTGMVDQRMIDKYSKEASENSRGTWFLAYILDTNEEERNKGITVEVGRAHFSTTKKRYTILDAPGHKAYVPNMMAGLAQADVGILVISARKGEFEAGFEKTGQTREHALLAKTLGIKKLIVLINKMDEPTVMWEEARYLSIQDKLGKYLKSIGFNMKTDVIWIPGSGYLGINIKDRVTPDVCPWYREGGSLLETLDELSPLDRLDESPLRIPVLDKYKESGKTYILGKVETGCLKVGDEIVSNPGNVALTVFQIQNDANIITVARPGENCKIVVKCSEVEEDQILRGSVISHPSSLCPVTVDLVGQIKIIELLEKKSLFTAGYACVFHTQTSQEECTVIRLLDLLDPKTGQSKQKLPTFCKEKAVVVAHFQLARPMCIEKFSDFQMLGRFTLRDEGRTIGFGKILATQAPIRQKRVHNK